MKIDEQISFKETKLDVVTMGELLVDMISSDYVPTLKEAIHFHKVFGGSPGNIAVNLARMNHLTALISCVGRDDFGDFLLEFLTDYGVGQEGIQVTDKATSMVFVTKSLENPSFLPVRHADLELRTEECQFRLIDQTKIFHFTAWALSHLEIRQTTMELLCHAKAQKKLITFDPNYRKVLWEKGHDGPGFILQHVLPMVDIIKPSESDAENLFGTTNRREFVRLLKQNSHCFVILTLGAEGLLAIDGEEVHHVPSHARRVVDTTGAGDAFWAGFMGAVLKGRSLRRALQLGSYSSAYKLGTVGAVCQLLEEEQLEAWVTENGKGVSHEDRVSQSPGKF